MALDVTSETNGIQPAFASSSSVGTTAVEIRADPFSQVIVFGDTDLYIFNGVAEGGSVPATARKALTSTQAAQGLVVNIGGKVPGKDYGTVCVAAQSGTGNTVEVMSAPPIRVAP